MGLSEFRVWGFRSLGFRAFGVLGLGLGRTFVSQRQPSGLLPAQDIRMKLRELGLGLGFSVEVHGLGFRVHGLEFRV